MSRLGSKFYNNGVLRGGTRRMEYHVNFRVDRETWLRLMEIQEESEVGLSYLIRKAIAPLLKIGSDYIHYIPVSCPKCEYPLSSMRGSNKVYCMKCGSTYRLEEIR